MVCICDVGITGKEAKKFMDAGKLVPDELIVGTWEILFWLLGMHLVSLVGLVTEKLNSTECLQKGWLLDGFPRTHSQVQ